MITHEIVHVLQERRYGKLKFNPFVHPEHWKLEGYPEYIARRPQRVNVDYDLPAEIGNFIDLEKKLPGFWIPITTGGCQVPKYYYKGRLMTEYLMDVKKYSYDNILNDTTSEAKIYAEMLAWRDSKKKSEK